jgi:hypothetical protein
MKKRGFGGSLTQRAEMPLGSYSGTFEPNDLALLQRVFDRITKQRGIPARDSQKSDKLAAEIVLLFSQGARTEEAHLQAIARCGSAPSMLVTIRRISDELFSVDWTTEKDVISIRVAVPQSKGPHIYTEAEREEIACKKAQNLALNFAESLVGEKCISVPVAS